LASVRVSLEGIGLSLINDKMEEVLYATLKELNVSLLDATTIQKADMTLKWFQVRFKGD
jgi:vacuolar protein sorting-associated protein 13A/C